MRKLKYTHGFIWLIIVRIRIFSILAEGWAKGKEEWRDLFQVTYKQAGFRLFRASRHMQLVEGCPAIPLHSLTQPCNCLGRGGRLYWWSKQLAPLKTASPFPSACSSQDGCPATLEQRCSRPASVPMGNAALPNKRWGTTGIGTNSGAQGTEPQQSKLYTKCKGLHCESLRQSLPLNCQPVPWNMVHNSETLVLLHFQFCT